jgi:hypothetical protein
MKNYRAMLLSVVTTALSLAILLTTGLTADAAKLAPFSDSAPTTLQEPLASQPSTTVVLPAIADAVLDANVNKNANLGGMNYLELYQRASSDVRHFLVRFDTSSLARDAQVQSARLEIHSFDADYDSGTQQALVHRVTRAWVEGTGLYFGADGRKLGATWNQAGPGTPWSRAGGDYEPAALDQITLPANPNAWFTWNVTGAVQQWVNGTPNDGLVVRPDKGDWLNHKFYSREATNTSLRPVLRVVYSSNRGTPSATPARSSTSTPTRTATRTQTSSSPTQTPRPTFTTTQTPSSPTQTPRPTFTATPQPTLPNPGGGPTLAGCPMFPSDNAWNRDVTHDPVDPNSATYIANISRNAQYLHADFGSPAEYGIPFVVVPGSQPRVPITFNEYGDESDPGPYPVPSNAPVEAGSDRHVLVMNSGECKLYEMYHATKDSSGAGWSAGSGAIFNLMSNALRPSSWTSADAAGLPILPGLVRYDEVTAGEIRHALRFTVWQTQSGYVLPATHPAGVNDPTAPPMGARLRLKASFDTSRFTGQARVVLEALKKYGMLIADNGSSWFITGATDPRWNDDDLNQLKTVPGSAFDVLQLGTVYR